VSDLTRPHRRYLRERGFDPNEVVRLWGVRGICMAARCGWSLWIPVHLRGEVVSWTTRSVSHQVVTRYVSAREDEEAVALKHCLYGLDYVRHSTVVVEGPTDAWRVGPGATATMGTAFTREQVALLAEIPRRAICFDRGRAAQGRAARLYEVLEGCPGETRMAELETGDDAASADAGEVAELRERYLE
jgi:DNA primase